jgi:hypothetical protein
MPRLPSARDVTQISPRVTADPGVGVPEGAFATDLGIATKEIAPGVDKYAQVIQKQEDRKNSIDMSRQIDRGTKAFDEKFREFDSEKDFSTDSAKIEFGESLSVIKENLLKEHKEQGGSNDSIARLTVRLDDIESQATGQAAGRGAIIARKNILTTLGDSVTRLADRASQNPTSENINAQLSELEVHIDDIRGGLEPDTEESARKAAQEQIVMRPIERFLARDLAESADSMLRDAGFMKYLSDDKQRQVMTRIENIRFAKEEAIRKVEKPSEREKRATQLQENYGLSKAFSEDIAAKDVNVVGPDKFGDFFAVNVATNTKVKVGANDRKALLRLTVGQTDTQTSEGPPVERRAAERRSEAAPAQRSLEDAVLEGTGPWNSIRETISNVVGPLGKSTGEPMFKETTDAKQQIRIFSQTAKIAVVNSDKFPAHEQKLVEKFLPDPEKFFKDPRAARSDLIQLKAELVKMKTSKETESKKDRISSERRALLADQVSGIDEILTLMKAPEKKTEAKTIKVLGKNTPVGETVTNKKGQRGRVEADGSITVLD